MALKFASASEFALVKGVELAKIHGAQLNIFHAMDYVLAQLDDSDPKVVELRKEAETYYESRVKPLLGDLKDVTFKCIPADPAMEVIKQAMQLDVDLIILGCHQLPEKMCLGRVDYVGITILEKAPCPVMLVPLCE
jgi:nucleotide-binding universal stress UspA family protein